MYYPQVQDNTNTRTMIDNFRGYNHNERIQPGEFYDMENMTSDGYPVLMPRKTRTTLVSAKYEITGMLYSGGDLAYLDGYVFHYSTWTIDLSRLVTGEENVVDTSTDPTEQELPTSWEEQTLLRFGAYVLIFPLNIWVNVGTDQKQAGRMNARTVSATGITVRYSICDFEANDMNIRFVSNTEPTGAQYGDYWLNTAEGKEGLNKYINNSWTPVATTYIKITVPGESFKDYFEVGDAINMNNQVLTDSEGVKHYFASELNNGSIIQALGDDYIVVIGLPDRAEPFTLATSQNWRFTVERPVPRMDYVCANENRVWGCRYGYNREDLHTLVNEIYCSKLGDFKNWYVYQGVSTDAYAVSVGEPGAWTGCISFQGYPTFFKENMIFKMYGSYPSEFSLYKTEARGVQIGSAKSMCMVGESLYYKAPTGIMAYDGSTPVLISQNLGRESYYFDGVAGAAGDKYYIEMSNEQGAHRLFVYDSQYGMWTKETALQTRQFANSRDGVLFASTTKNIYGLGRASSLIYSNKIISDVDNDAFYVKKMLPDEEYVEWNATTGDMGYEYADYKYVDKITVRAFVEHKAEICIQISYDDGKFEDVGILRGFDETKSQSIDIVPYRCDHFKLKFNGHGVVKIYSIAITLDTGSEEYGYNKN